MPIVSAKEKTDEAVKEISRFQSGEITPISTGISWIDEIMIGGLLPSTILTIGGLSNHGKTHLMQRIENNILDNDEKGDIVLLRCNWESAVYKLLLRKLKEKTGAKLSDLLFNEQRGETLRKIKAICAQERRDGLYYMEEPCLPDEFFRQLAGFFEAHKDKKIIVTVDHVGLVKGREKTSIDGLFEMMNLLKKMHPFVVFLPLIQMHRERILSRVEDVMRQQPQQGDFYGSDQLFQVSDGVIAIYNAYKAGIQGKYMAFHKDKYPYIDPKFILSKGGKWNHFKPEGNIFYHAVKARDIDDMETFPDVWVEQIYEVKDEPTEELDPQTVEELLNN